MRVAIIIVLLGNVIGDSTFEYTGIAKQCIEKIGSNEETIRKLVPEVGEISVDNDVILKFFECCFQDFIDDKGNIDDNEKFNEYVEMCFSFRMHNAKPCLIKLVSKECINHCKHVKGKNNGETGVKVMNCLKAKFQDYVEV